MLNGREIKTQLVMKDIKQNDIKRFCGVSKSYISMMLNDRREFSKELYDKIIEFINFTPSKREDIKKQWALEDMEKNNLDAEKEIAAKEDKKVKTKKVTKKKTETK